MPYRLCLSSKRNDAVLTLTLTLTEQNYLKAIYHLGRAVPRVSNHPFTIVNTGLLAESVGVKSPAATSMVHKLADKSLVLHEKSKGVSLTSEGESMAVQIIRRHRIWKTFLAKTLGFDWCKVQELAEHLEHIQLEELIDRLEKHLGYPNVDPHGDPIPDANGRANLLPTVALTAIRVGGECWIARLLGLPTTLLYSSGI